MFKKRNSSNLMKMNNKKQIKYNYFYKKIYIKNKNYINLFFKYFFY